MGAGAQQQGRLEVRNPVAELATAPTPRAPRVERLDGLRVGRWWNKKAGGEVALETVAEALASRAGTTSEPFYGRYPGAPDVIEECAARSDVVVGATAD
jgi:hypothetical protein